MSNRDVELITPKDYGHLLGANTGAEELLFGL